MVKSLLTTSFNTRTTAAGSTQYWVLGTGPLTQNNTEANVAIPYPAGTLSKLFIRLTASTTSASSTFVVRKAGVDQALTISIPAATTGTFEDATNTVSVSNGDLLNYKVVSGGTGAMNISIMSVIFDATTNCISKLVLDGYPTNTASSSRYVVVSGAAAANSTSTTVPVNTIRKVATVKNFSTAVSANARTTNTVFTVRKNTVDNTITLTYGNLETGLKQDTTHTDTTAAGDTLGYKVTTLAGTETLTTDFHAIEIEHATHGLVSASSIGASADNIPNFGETWFMGVGGSTALFATQTDARQKARSGFIISELTLRANVNTLNGNCSVTLQKNGVDTALALIMTAGSTTTISDSTNAVTVASGDDLNLRITSAGSSGAITLRQVALWLKPVPELSLNESTTISEASMVRQLGKPRISAPESVSIGETRNRVNGAVRAMAAQTVAIAEDLDSVVSAAGGAVEKIITEAALTISEGIARLKAVWRYQP